MSGAFDGLRMLRQLADAAKQNKAVYSRFVNVTGVDRSIAAAWLRDRGVPIVATRQRHLSMWYLLRESDPSRLKRQWRNRILGDVYSELTRASRALSGLSSGRSEMHELQGFAVQVGSWLGKDPATVLTEARPLTIPADAQAILDEVDQALGGP